MTAGESATSPPSDMACHLCGDRALSLWSRASDAEYATSDDVFDYFRCAACGGLSISPCPEDRLAEIYPDSYYSFSGESFSLLGLVKHALDRRLYRSIFASIPGPSLAALDVGGGDGGQLSQARRVEPRLTRTVVVDIDPAARSGALAAGHEFVLSRIEDLDLPGPFDLIAMLNLIEHVKDPVSALAKAGGRLTEKGLLLIKTPNCDSWDARLFRRSYWGGLHAPRHWSVATPEGFRALADRAGLVVTRLELTQGAPFWAASVLAWLVGKGWASVSAERPMFRHPLFGVLLAGFAALDFARRPFARTSQMFVVLRRAEAAAET